MFDVIRKLERLSEPEMNDYLQALQERVSPIKGKVSMGDDSLTNLGSNAYGFGFDHIELYLDYLDFTDGDGFGDGQRNSASAGDIDGSGTGYGFLGDADGDSLDPRTFFVGVE